MTERALTKEELGDRIIDHLSNEIANVEHMTDTKRMMAAMEGMKHLIRLARTISPKTEA